RRCSCKTASRPRRATPTPGTALSPPASPCSLVVRSTCCGAPCCATRTAARRRRSTPPPPNQKPCDERRRDADAPAPRRPARGAAGAGGGPARLPVRAQLLHLRRARADRAVARAAGGDRAMRRPYHRRNKFEGQFAGRLRAMLESPAYRVLTLSAHRLLSRIEIELCKHGGED